jgi:hypothetical protein
VVLADGTVGSLRDRTQKGSLIILRRWQRSCLRREFIPRKDLANPGACGYRDLRREVDAHNHSIVAQSVEPPMDEAMTPAGTRA